MSSRLLTFLFVFLGSMLNIVYVAMAAIHVATIDPIESSIQNEMLRSIVISDAPFFQTCLTNRFDEINDLLNSPLYIEDGKSSHKLNYTLQDIFPSLSFLMRIKAIAKEMNVFPVDLIARKGPLCFYPYGDRTGTIECRNELTHYQWELFYSFCHLALHASDEDVECCISALPDASPTVQVLLLTVLYIHAYPWSEVLIKDNASIDDYSNNWSWLGKNIMCFQYDFSKNACPESEKCKRYKNVICQYVSDNRIAFDRIIQNEDYGINIWMPFSSKLYQSKYYQECMIYNRLRDEYLNAQTRLKLCESIRKQYPNDYFTMISDMLYLSLEYDLFGWFNSGRGTISRHDNASSVPKTVGQIATQLLESWATPESLNNSF